MQVDSTAIDSTENSMSTKSVILSVDSTVAAMQLNQPKQYVDQNN